MARVHARITDRRRDHLHKLTTRLVRENQAVVIEDLQVRNMLGNHSLARAISDAAWRELRGMLEYKCRWYGRDLVVVDRWFPSSKVCSACGALRDRMPLSVREWTCRCGATPRPRRQRGPQHSCRRAGGARLWRRSKTCARKRTRAVVGEAGTLPGDRENPRLQGGEKSCAGPYIPAGRAAPYPVRVGTRVVLAEDNSLLRHGLVRLIQGAPDLELVGSAADLPALKALIETQTPDVVVTDIRMPPTNTDEGIAIAASLRTMHPEMGVLLLSQYAEASYALTLLAEGTARRGYLLKERVADGDELTDAIRRVADGGSVIDPTVIEGLVAANRAKPSELDALTPRELQVLGEMAQGKSNASIAATLVLSERAIEKHTNSIFSKLGLSEERDLNRRVSAVLVYLHNR